MRHLFIVISLAAVFFSTAALAGARQHFMAGQDYYTQGRYKKAIEEFDEAYRLDPKPLLLFNIAQSYEKLGDLPKAVEYLKQYLEEDPEVEERATLENKIKNLESRIASTGITVKVNESEAKIYVDDKEVGTTPLDGVIPVDTGTHKVRIQKEGFLDFTMNIAVSLGHSVPIEATLEPAEAGPIPPPKEAPKEEVGAAPEEDKGLEALDVVPWVIAGVGGVMAVVGLGVIGGIAKAKEPDEPDKEAQNDAHKKAVIADAIGWPGLALAVGGTVWGVVRLLSDESSDDEDDSVAVVPFVDNNRAGVTAAFTF